MVTGMFSGALGFIVASVVLGLSGVLGVIAERMRLPVPAAACVVGIVALVAGGLYGRIFMRAANDRGGGWLFGIGFGFLLWMLGPGTVVSWIWGEPLLTGRAGQAFLAGHLLYGLVLGLAFPRVHAVVKGKLDYAGDR
jgi:hypothetical protein